MRLQVIERMTTLVTSAFGLVAALAWNNTIRSAFERVFGTPDELLAMAIYAILVTVIAVGATIWLAAAAERAKKRARTD